MMRKLRFSLLSLPCVLGALLSFVGYFFPPVFYHHANSSVTESLAYNIFIALSHATTPLDTIIFLTPFLPSLLLLILLLVQVIKSHLIGQFFIWLCFGASVPIWLYNELMRVNVLLRGTVTPGPGIDLLEIGFVITLLGLIVRSTVLRWIRKQEREYPGASALK